MTDVNNAFVVDCIASYESYRFSAYTSGLKTMLQWLLNRNCKDICIESTGKYWLEELILALAAPYQQELAILQTAPGIRSDFTSIGIISEIGTNMEAFPSAKHLCSWAGLTPTNNESAGKKKSVRVSKAGCYIKPLLVQCANAVVTSKKHPEIRNRYLRLKKRRGHKKAIIAIARMLLTALYHMLKNGENYNAELYRKSDLPPANREITVEQAIIIARNQGYKIKLATA